MVTYLWRSHSTSVSKSCGGGCRKLVRCCCLLFVNWFQSHCILSLFMVAMCFSFWSYTLATELFIWIVGLLTRISLSGLHSWVEVIRLVIFSGGWMNFLSLVCTCER